jgi:hypothetical protein
MALDQRVSPSISNEGDGGAYKEAFPYGTDPETTNPAEAKRRRNEGHLGARIAPVLPHLKGYDFGDGDSAREDILGKQIELEQGNALQYRTCSWQKVC